MEKTKLFDKVTAKVPLKKKDPKYKVLNEVCKDIGVTCNDSTKGVVIKATLDQLTEIEKQFNSKLAPSSSTSSRSEKSDEATTSSVGEDFYKTEPYMTMYINRFCSQDIIKIEQTYGVKITWSEDGTGVIIKSNNLHSNNSFMQACSNFLEMYKELYNTVKRLPFDVTQNNDYYSRKDLESVICQVPETIDRLILLKAQDGKSYELFGTAAALDTAKEWIRKQLGLEFSSTKKNSSLRSQNMLSHETPNKINVVVYKGDITNENADIIVNASNKDLQHVGGVSWAIANAGGWSIQKESDAYVRKHGRVNTGDIAVTGSGNLKCKCVVHAVGPIWEKMGKEGSIDAIRQICTNVFNVVRRYGFKSVAMPAISTGVYGVPRELCAQTIFASVDDLDRKVASNSLGSFELRLVNIDAETTKVFAEEFHKWKLQGRKVVRRNSFNCVSSAKQPSVKPASASDMNTVPKIKAPIVNKKALSTTSPMTTMSTSVSPSRPGFTSRHLSINRKSSEQSTVQDVAKRRTTTKGTKQSMHSSTEQRDHVGISTNTTTVSAIIKPDAKTSTKKNLPNQDTESSKNECPICKCTITNPKVLSKCGHTFCTPCIDTAFNYVKKCPICQEVYGIAIGTQPDGTMNIDCVRGSLPGYEGYDHFVITYNIPSGKQDSRHPNPGQFYYGTSRYGYVPATKEGEEVVKLLKKAFDKKLIFTVGRSTTTGQENCVTWNDIHHKTRMGGGPQSFGYPDPDYLRRVKDELKAKGIVPE